MIRVLFIVLAMVATILAFVLDLSMLYAVAGVLLLLAVIAHVVTMQRRHREASKPYAPKPKPEAEASSDDDLKSLGIMDIRPRSESTAEAERDMPSTSPGTASAEAVTTTEEDDGAVPEAAPAEERNGAHPGPSRDAAAVTSPRPKNRDRRRDVLQPYLQSIQAATGALTVCLLKQEDIEPRYHIEALVSRHSPVQREGSFMAKAPLLTASMGQQAVSVRHVGSSGVPLTSLGYYREPVGVRQVALAPVSRPNHPDMYVLVADATEDHLLDAQRQRALLAQFAQTLGTLLNALEPEPAPDEGAGDAVRPRREIIAEEMDRAREHEQPLALSLVFLNRAEVLADEGIGAVAAAERMLKRRLEEATPDGRVERFGELTYGVFYPGDATEVEAWAAQIQHELDDDEGPLEGGVSVGIALLRERHETPDALRADATEALREAYESGACTILE